MKEGYIPQKDRKKILFLCDDIRMHSGVATMAREIIVGTAHRYNWVNIGAAINHPEVGKRMDLSGDTNKHAGLEDSSIILYPQNGYGTPELIRYMLQVEKPDAILFFTDPRYYEWLFQIEHELRQQIPLIYLNIWDDYPAPLYNKPYYESCDTLLGISKQTTNINKLVLGEKAEGKLLKYVPHGINPNSFFPINTDYQKYPQFLDYKRNVFNGKEFEYVVFFNSRNIRRKHPSDLIAAFQLFKETLPKDKADKVALLLHTSPIDNNGTDLLAVRELFGGNDSNVYFTPGGQISTEQMNWLYNIADLTVLPSGNEGWGLSLTESMMAETMIAATVTGGMQDQMKFLDKKGKWYTPDEKIPSNHFGTYKEHGEWALPMFPDAITLVGSPKTPYIWDDIVDFRTIAKTIEESYKLSPKERTSRGKEGRKWATSDEAMMSSKWMCKNVDDAIESTITNFTPSPKYTLDLVEDYPLNTIKHKITY